MLRTLRFNQTVTRTCHLAFKHHVPTRRTLISARQPLFVLRAEQGGGGYKQAKDLLKSIEEKQSIDKKKLRPTKPATKTLWEKVKEEAVHYWHGTKLLGLEVRISSRLAYKLLQGTKLTRRENRQVFIYVYIYVYTNMYILIFYIWLCSFDVLLQILYAWYHLLYFLLFHLWNCCYLSH